MTGDMAVSFDSVATTTVLYLAKTYLIRPCAELLFVSQTVTGVADTTIFCHSVKEAPLIRGLQ